MNTGDVLKNKRYCLSLKKGLLAELVHFARNSQCCLTVASCERYLLVKYRTSKQHVRLFPICRLNITQTLVTDHFKIHKEM